MNCFLKMGSLAKIIDLTTWPHNNHIFQQHLYMRFTKYHDRWPSWSNPFVQRLENWPWIWSTLEINITFIMMRLGGDHSLLCSCRMWAYCYAKFKFSWHTYAKMCRQNMPKWQNVFTKFHGRLVGCCFLMIEILHIRLSFPFFWDCKFGMWSENWSVHFHKLK
jgi:hypothetical protein